MGKFAKYSLIVATSPYTYSVVSKYIMLNMKSILPPRIKRFYDELATSLCENIFRKK